MQPIGFGNLKKDTPHGIEFREGKRYLYFQGQMVAESALTGDFAQRDYFYHLRFLEDFPDIPYWAFGDAWTQRIKVLRPRRESADTLTGYVCFGDDDTRGMYVIERAYDPPPRAVFPEEVRLPAPWVQAPMPTLFHIPLNLPLQLIVARAVLAALDDNWPYEQWQFVTSVVERAHVPDVLVTDIAAAFGFRLKGVPLDLRQALCDFQGLRN